MLNSLTPSEPAAPLPSSLVLAALFMQDVHIAGPGPLREEFLEHSKTTLALAVELGLLARLPRAAAGGPALIQATALGRAVGEAWHLPVDLLRHAEQQRAVKSLNAGMRPVAWELAPAARAQGLTASAVRLEEVEQQGGAARYAIRQGGNCLGNDGQWELEPQPSSRDAEFLTRCRFETIGQALAAWQRAQPQ